MKKTLLAVLAVAFALSLVACGAKSTSDKGPNCGPNATAEQCKGG